MRDADLTPTGRELKDTSGTLVECTDSKGLKHTVIAYDAPFIGHSALTTAIDLIMGFMAFPMVTGLVECTAADTRRARFAYPTGTIWTVKEILRGFEQVGQKVGPRAALELCYLGGMILHEAGDTGPIQGCFSHGNLNPWRVGMKADGQLQVFGYGLAQVEMIEFIGGRLPHLDGDSIRFAPPERLEGQPEQPSSDTYSLAVIAYEMITGRTLFPEVGGPEMWEAVKLAQGTTRVMADKSLPQGVREMLASAMIYDPDTRLQGEGFVDAAGSLLDDPRIEGRTLADVMLRMQATGRSARKLVKASATAAFSMSELAAMAAQEADEDDVDLDTAEVTDTPRWAPVRERTTGRSRVRAERAPPEPASTPRKRPPPEPVDDDEADESLPRRRRRRAEAEVPAPEPEAFPRRRRRPIHPEEDDVPKAGQENESEGDPDDELTLPPPEDEEITLPPPERAPRAASPTVHRPPGAPSSPVGSGQAAPRVEAPAVGSSEVASPEVAPTEVTPPQVAAPGTGVGDSAEDGLDGDVPRRRRRRLVGDDASLGAPEAPAPATPAAPAATPTPGPLDAAIDEPADAPRRRRRRLIDGADDPPSTPDAPAEPAAATVGDDPEGEDGAPRRRRRRIE